MEIILTIISALCVLFFLEMINYKSSYELQKSLNKSYLRRITYLEHFLSAKSKKYNIDCNEDILDAVKLAMKVSHPDNGGKQEDFIKYREVYLKLTKKRG